MGFEFEIDMSGCSPGNLFPDPMGDTPGLLSFSSRILSRSTMI
jgi:hypothetical protein